MKNMTQEVEVMDVHEYRIPEWLTMELEQSDFLAGKIPHISFDGLWEDDE